MTFGRFADAAEYFANPANDRRSGQPVAPVQPRSVAMPRDSQAGTPVARFAVLMSNREVLWPGFVAWFVHNRVREAVQVIDAKTEPAMRPTEWVLDQQIAHTLELREKRFGDRQTFVFQVVDRRIAKLGLSVWVDPIAHAMRARTLASASSPGTIPTLPELTSSRLAFESCNHAAWAADRGSTLLGESKNLE